MSKGQGSIIQSKYKSLVKVTTGEEDDMQEEDETEENYEEEDGEMEEEPNTRASKVALEVKHGDLTTFEADVLVNTYSGKDKDLTKCGQVCRAFYKVGGEQMQKLYEEAINDRKFVAVTQACDNLKCTHIFYIHIQSLNRYSYRRLEDQIYRCLQKASELKTNSIVFPTVGGGRLNYKPWKVVRCFKRAIKTHESHDTCCVSKVIIASYGHMTYQQFEQLVSTTDSPQPSAVAAMMPKVQAEKPEVVLQTKGRPAYLQCIANRPIEIPDHWKSVKTLQDEQTAIEPVDVNVAKAIEDVVRRTWQQHLVGHGRDASNLNHKTITVTKVEQIENPHLYRSYEHVRKALCTRTTKRSYPKVTSDPGETDVLTSTLGISVLDEQLIPEINEHFLFHGAKQENIESISMQGIDFRLSKQAMFGKGSYFCESSTKADQYADHKHQRKNGPHSMFLVKVILGHSHIAKKPDNMSRPPCLHHCNDSCKHGLNEFYDSVMGTHRDSSNRLIFREFITYEKSQSYPAYLITYVRK